MAVPSSMFDAYDPNPFCLIEILKVRKILCVNAKYNLLPESDWIIKLACKFMKSTRGRETQVSK